jgi:hypothetical protein
MQAVHRSFYNTVIIAVEQGLSDICKKEGLAPTSRRAEEAEIIIKRAELERELEDKIRQLAGSRLNFSDYLNTVLKEKVSDTKRRKIWNNFFDALGIVRNKVSHSDTSLTPNEIDRLVKGGFSTLVSKTKELQVNTRNYKQIVDFILQFYREVNI